MTVIGAVAVAAVAAPALGLAYYRGIAEGRRRERADR